MEEDFVNKFKCGNKLNFENNLYEIVDVRSDFAYYDFELDKPIDKHICVTLHKKDDLQIFSGDSFLIFYEDDRIVLNRTIKKNVSIDFVKLLRKSKKGDKVDFENKKFEIKEIVQTINGVLLEGKTYETYNYVLVSNINDKEKISMNILDYKEIEKYDVNYLETRDISEKEIQFIWKENRIEAIRIIFR